MCGGEVDLRVEGKSLYHYFWWNKVLSITCRCFKLLLCFPVQVKFILQSTAGVLEIMACQETALEERYNGHQATGLLAFSSSGEGD